MSRGILFLFVLVLLLAGAIVYLSMSAEEVPQQIIEAEVVSDAGEE